jgi:hypothetical protein
MPDTGTFTTHPALAPLPPLVRKQRTLEAKILPLAPLVEDEKKVRQAIDALLIAAGLKRGESVTCNGYEVTHAGRSGNTALNVEAAEILFVLGGVDPEFVAFVLTTCLETGEAPFWATVKPCKGAHVRKGLTEKRRR